MTKRTRKIKPSISTLVFATSCTQDKSPRAGSCSQRLPEFDQDGGPRLCAPLRHIGLLYRLRRRPLRRMPRHAPHAVPVARATTLLRYPQVRKALEGLAGRISAADMQEMNHAAEAQHEDPADIARRFLNR